jgi:hypothetical protein
MLDELLLEGRVALEAERLEAQEKEQQTGVYTFSAQTPGVSVHAEEVTA